jgi:hypothetical protein
MHAHRRFPQCLENECGNPTHDRLAELRQSFRKIPPSRAIAQALLAVRLHHDSWGASFGPSGLPWSGCHRLARVLRHRQASIAGESRRDPRSQVNSPHLGAAQLCSVCVMVIKRSRPANWVARKENGVNPPSVHR